MSAVSKPCAQSPRLTVGRGMGLRVTKAGKAAEARFDALVTEHLQSIGATPPEPGLEYRGWIVQTIHGALKVSPHGNWIAQMFLDWPKNFEECIAHAKARGFDHWKWNFHYELTAEPNVEDWKFELGRLLLPQDARKIEPAVPAPDWRARYETEVLHREELQRQIEEVFDHALRTAGGDAAVRPAIIAMRDRYRRKVG